MPLMTPKQPLDRISTACVQLARETSLNDAQSALVREIRSAANELERKNQQDAERWLGTLAFSGRRMS